MLRPSLLSLIRRVRALLGEQDEDAYACSFWSDTAIADALTERGMVCVGLPLLSLRTADPDQILAYSTYQNWDEATRLTDIRGNDVTTIHADPIAGQWVISNQNPGLIYVSGVTYDIYGVAADLATSKATAAASRVDVKTGDQQVSRSQESAALLKLAAEYRKKARPKNVKVGRADAY